MPQAFPLGGRCPRRGRMRGHTRTNHRPPLRFHLISHRRLTPPLTASPQGEALLLLPKPPLSGAPPPKAFPLRGKVSPQVADEVLSRKGNVRCCDIPPHQSANADSFSAHRRVTRFSLPSVATIGTLPRNRLASSATGGASAVSPRRSLWFAAEPCRILSQSLPPLGEGVTAGDG